MSATGLPPESHRLAPDRLPTPFSAEQIRDASPPGTRLSFSIEAEGEATLIERWEYIATGERDGRLRRWSELPDGTVVDGPSEETATWLSLQAHASYPSSTTKLSTGTVEVPAGRFECWIYRVRNDDGSETVASFAFELPGPPVLMETRRGGDPIFRMALVEVLDG